MATDGEARVMAPPPLGATELVALEGGVSGAVVWRADVAGRSVVIKRTDRVEIDTLQRLADLGEPLIPTMIDFGEDDHGPWLMIDFHSGPPAGLLGGLPDQVHRCLGRIHAHFDGRAFDNNLERIDEAFVIRAMTEFAPHTLIQAKEIIDEGLDRRARELLQRLVSDDTFRTASELFDRTLLHGDLYGMNVLLPSTDHSDPLIIDWNTTRVGPAMFDVAMTADYASSARLAHDRGWAEVAGRSPDPWVGATSHAWSQALLHATYAGVLAIRHSAEESERMVAASEAAYDSFRVLVQDQL